MTLSSNMQCLITGCELIHQGRIAHGDLHKVGDCYVFNACVDRTGQTAWQEFTELPQEARSLVIPDNEEFFERRGVFIVHISRALLNIAAVNFLKKWG